MNKQEKSEPTLKETLMNRIESENVCPRSRVFFRCRECFVWTFWLVSVIVGALAVAVSLFVMMHHQYALYEATHHNFLTFIVETLPYLWLIVFVAMSLFAIYNLRHTKKGYRYPVWVILASSVVASFAGGSVLQFLGFGYTIDRVLGENMAMYMSQAKQERQLWQMPEDGRLIGRQVLTTTIPTSTVIFEDSTGVRWTLNVSELTQMDLDLLATEREMRLLGTTTDLAAKRFFACGAFPWVLDKPMKMQELSAERQTFIDRVYDHKHRAEARLAELEEEAFAVSVERREDMMGTCARIAPVRRIEASMY